MFARLLQTKPAGDGGLASYTGEDVAKHSSQKDLWLILDGKVYDVTDWQKKHPGGAAALLQYAGRDATEAAAAAHGENTRPAEMMQEFLIGTFNGGSGGGAAGAGAEWSAVTPRSGNGEAKERLKDKAVVIMAEDGDSEPIRRRIERKQTAAKLQPNAEPPPPPDTSAAADASAGAAEGGKRGPLNMTPPPPPPDALAAPNLAAANPGGLPAAADTGVAAEEEEAEEEEEGGFVLGADINIHTFEELRLEAHVIEQAKSSWSSFCQGQGTREAAGEAIYNALFEGAPSLQALFTTPRAVQAMRFMSGLHSFVTSLDNPKQLKALVETLGFGHLHLDVTVPRVVIFRDSILELFEIELGEDFSADARDGWLALLNYVGGAIIYVRTYYAERLRVLEDSWKKASDPDYGNSKKAAAADVDGGASEDGQNSDQGQQKIDIGDALSPANTEASRKSKFSLFSRRRKRTGSDGGSPASQQMSSMESPHSPRGEDNKVNNVAVVRTFEAMFDFNAAVMGFNSSSSAWLREVVKSFNNLVTNISNPGRLQEECDVLVLKITKCTKGDINLAEFKSAMLATLRSLLPKEWDSTHEVAWNWLWDNIERLLRKSLGQPQSWVAALSRLMDSIDEETGFELRSNIYQRFFLAAPGGQEHFKQSDTRLHFIADQIMKMTVELFSEPHRMVDDISALGLRHVGYGIPTDLFGPFVTVTVDALAGYCEDATAIEAFRWSLGLISKMLTRTITEGSTIVMKAINANSVPQLKKALTCAPRAWRTGWLLKVEVGTQSISPLMWAIESGRLEAARAIIQDLLVIRADREKYYYGVEDLFGRHDDIMKRLIQDAPVLLPPLLEGLVWRSRVASGGNRRVNYYVKHLIITPDEGISDTLSWLVQAKDPKIMAHDVMVLVSDTLWNGMVCRQFIYSKIWFIASLLLFMLSQAILPKSESADELHMRIIVFIGRLAMYLVTMCRLIYSHTKFCLKAYKEQDTMKCFRCIRLPSYLRDPRDSGGFLLMLLLVMMCTHEPMFHCIGPENHADFPTQTCEAADGVAWGYSVFCMGAMAIHWLLLIDLSVFSTGLSAFVLVIGQVLSEMTRFLTTLVWLLLTFGSAISVLEHNYFEMRDIPNTAIALFSITIRLYEDDYRNMLFEPALLAAVFMFVTASAVVLLNLLIAQINCSYVYIYQDMVGFARLNRADVICETLEKSREVTWVNFVKTLKLNEPLEFNEGDVGLPGGIQILEPASLHPTTEDSIQRFGGSCAPDTPWPEEGTSEEENRYNRLEKMLKKVLRRVGKSGVASKHRNVSGASFSADLSMTDSGDGTGSGSGDTTGSTGD